LTSHTKFQAPIKSKASNSLDNELSFLV